MDIQGTLWTSQKNSERVHSRKIERAGGLILLVSVKGTQSFKGQEESLTKEMCQSGQVPGLNLKSLP